MRGLTKKVATVISALLLSAGFAAASDPGTADSRGTKSKVTAAKSRSAVKRTQVGRASWYGKAFHGRQTASGEDYDMFQLTAAHRSLPLGTYVKVTNLRNGKWAVLKVNDRGPYVGDRILDVSYGAAQILNFRGRGVEKVSIEVVEPQTLAVANSIETVD
ncbi:MAG TPA: septal ring lytic transglycosylase RlpA family protein [Terriglobales bacterium]|nr:septal ring lytic transglycosylase RlpA family protein [Terriglobales bacterium]